MNVRTPVFKELQRGLKRDPDLMKHATSVQAVKSSILFITIITHRCDVRHPFHLLQIRLKAPGDFV